MENPLRGTEPGLGARLTAFTGAEPMLGGRRRAKLDRTLFWDLLNIDSFTRQEAINRVLDQGAARFYAAAMVAVLSPDARYHKLGHLWKVAYTYYHKLAAMDSLVRLDARRALSGLIVAMKNDDMALRQAAISCIGRLETVEAEFALFDILDDPRQPIRHAALQALADRWQLPAIRRLTSPIGSLVSEAAAWLSEMEQPRVFDPLVSVLRDHRPGNVNQEIAERAVIDALGQLGARFSTECAARVTVTLTHVLADGKLTLTSARRAVEALERIGTDDARASAIVYRTQYNLTG